jgi:hypothetical protein
MKEKVNLRDPSREDEQRGNGDYPWRPNEIFDEILLATFSLFIIYGHQTFLQCSHRAEIAAKRPAQKERQKKLQREHDKAARDNAVNSSEYNQVRRKVENNHREKQECGNCYSFPYFLPFFHFNFLPSG